MTAPPPTAAEPPPTGGIMRRIAVCAVIGVLLFGLLWYTVFSAVTAALVVAGSMGVLVAGSTVSDSLESLFDMLANMILGSLAAIAAFVAAIFSFFD